GGLAVQLVVTVAGRPVLAVDVGGRLYVTRVGHVAGGIGVFGRAGQIAEGIVLVFSQVIQRIDGGGLPVELVEVLPCRQPSAVGLGDFGLDRIAEGVVRGSRFLAGDHIDAGLRIGARIVD